MKAAIRSFLKSSSSLLDSVTVSLLSSSRSVWILWIHCINSCSSRLRLPELLAFFTRISMNMVFISMPILVSIDWISATLT